MNNHKRQTICLLTSVHGPFDVRIFHKEAKSLAQRGYSVTVVAPYGHHTQVDGISIKAIPVPTSRLQRMSVTLWRAFRSALKTNASIFHFHDPELIPVGILLKLWGKCVVYDVHEDLPKDILDKEWIAPSLRRPIARTAGWIETLVASRIDAIVAATPAIARNFSSRKCSVVQNFPRQNELAAMANRPYSKRNPWLIYLGAVTQPRGACEMVKAMEYFPQGDDTRLVVAGEFDPPSLAGQLLKQAGWNKVDNRGWQSRENVRTLLSSARVGLLLFHALPNHMESQPTKLFEYMSAGIPVIASDFPLWREIVEGAGCGLLVDPLDPKAIAEAAEWILRHPTEAEEMGERAAAAVSARFNWAAEEEKLLELYQRLTERNA